MDARDAGDADARRRLAAFFADAAGAERVTVGAMTPMTGGAIQENWSLDLALEGGDFAGELGIVLRTDAPSAVAASHDRAREFALLSAAHRHHVPVPEPLWLCQDADVLGKVFFTMRRVAGEALGHRVVRLGSQALAEELGAALASIHAIRPGADGLEFLALPEESPALAAVAGLRGYLDRHPVARPALEWGLAWLARHAPEAGEIVLAHQDYRTGNFLVDNGRLMAILDWEFANWSDPHQDIGWFCAKCWRYGRDALEAGGIGDREAFYRGYENRSGRSIERAIIPYWEAMAHARWAAIALQQAERHLSGEEQSLELALTAHVVPELEFELMRQTMEG